MKKTPTIDFGMEDNLEKVYQGFLADLILLAENPL